MICSSENCLKYTALLVQQHLVDKAENKKAAEPRQVRINIDAGKRTGHQKISAEFCVKFGSGQFLGVFCKAIELRFFIDEILSSESRVWAVVKKACGDAEHVTRFGIEEEMSAAGWAKPPVSPF